MSILIKDAHLIDVRSKYHDQRVNVLLEKGKISKIGKTKFSAKETVDANGAFLTIGWMDMQTQIGDPGFEHKEDLDTASLAARAGGFTEIAVLPGNKPVTQTKNDVAYLKRSMNGVRLHPIAAVTHDLKGEDLTEMIDLHAAGAVAFSDGLLPIWHADIVLKSLQYLQKFKGLLIQRPEDRHLNLFGTMHEGPTSTALGLKGLPSLSEDIMIQRDLEILSYAGGRLHFSNVSTSKGLDMIREAKQNGLSVTCDIAAHQITFHDTDLTGFDTNYKVNPPFRGAEEEKKIIKALKDGTIDVIVSSHQPQDEESKKLEYDLAEFGINGLQTVAHHLAHLSKQVKIADLLHKITHTPRELLNIKLPDIEPGAEANLTLFDPEMVWKLDDDSNYSRSRNNPLFNHEVKGGIKAVFLGKSVFQS